MTGSADDFDRTIRTILTEARTAVAARRPPDVPALEERLRRAGAGPDAVAQLRAIASVHRARATVARQVEPPPAAARPSRRPALRTRPTITGSLGVRRGEGDVYRLEWDPVPVVAEWEVRFSERPDARSDYAERSVVVLAPGETSVEVPLGDNALRVHILGRGRGRVQRRALISGLTRDGWRSRWQRRAGA
jgi:hypothetical protein